MKVEITLKSGVTRVYEEESRPGGSYQSTVRYEGAFVIVTDVWGKETAIPAADIAQVVTTPRRY